MYFKNFKSNLSTEKPEAQKLNLINHLIKKVRDKNSIYFSLDAAGRGKEIQKLFLGA